MGINQTKRQSQLSAWAPHATKLYKDTDGHRVDPEHEGGEGVEDGVADEDTDNGVERGEVEVVEDVADDDADVRCQVVDQKANGDLSKGWTVEFWPDKDWIEKQ